MTKSQNATNRHSSTGATIIKTWQCPACTYENCAASVVCDICQSPRGLANTKSNETAAPPTTTVLDMNRQESKLMENLRKIEESEARTKWENIIQYCREVSVSETFNMVIYVKINFLCLFSYLE